MTRSEFNDFLIKISRKMYGFSYHMLKNQTEAEDAVQEVLIKLWKLRDKLDHYENVEALAMKMTRNYCLDILRKLKRIHQNNIIDPSVNNPTELSPHERLENSESFSVIINIMDKMPEHYRELISLRDISGFSYEEMAVITDQNVNALRVSLSRARKMLREQYKKYYNE